MPRLNDWVKLAQLRGSVVGGEAPVHARPRLGHSASHAETPLVFKSFFWYTPHERVISNHCHRQILGALKVGDGERAEIVMREHIYEGRDFVIKALSEDLEGETR